MNASIGIADGQALCAAVPGHLTVHARIRYAERHLPGGRDLVAALRAAGWGEPRVLPVLERYYREELGRFEEAFSRAVNRIASRPELQRQSFVLRIAGAVEVAVVNGVVGTTTLPARRPDTDRRHADFDAETRADRRARRDHRFAAPSAN